MAKYSGGGRVKRTEGMKSTGLSARSMWDVSVRHDSGTDSNGITLEPREQRKGVGMKKHRKRRKTCIRYPNKNRGD